MPSNSDDIIFFREVIDRISELEGERDDYVPTDEHPERTWTTDCDDDWAELTVLQALQEEADGYADDWKDGAMLIRDSYFQEYAQQFAEDIGAIDPNATWPNTCIDWERAARELQQDYAAVDFDGVTYWVR